MRKLAYLLPLSLVVCSGIDTFEVSQSASANVPAGTLVEQLLPNLGLGIANFDVTQSQELANQGVTKDELDSVRANRLTLTVKDPPSGQDLRFIESLNLFVESPGLTKVRFAHGANFPVNANTVDLELDDVELAPYAAAESMTVSSEATGRRPAQNTTVELTLSLIVDVNVGGAICGG